MHLKIVCTDHSLKREFSFLYVYRRPVFSLCQSVKDKRKQMGEGEEELRQQRYPIFLGEL